MLSNHITPEQQQRIEAWKKYLMDKAQTGGQYANQGLMRGAEMGNEGYKYINQKASDLWGGTKQMGTDFMKIFEAGKSRAVPADLKKYEDELKVVAPGDRKQLYDILKEMDKKGQP